LDWDIHWVPVTRLGVSRLCIGVNNEWPPPPIHASLLDTIHLTVTNSLPDALSLHAHGLHQNNSNFMDGAAAVSACPVPPKASFQYKYRINQTGSFWIHGHANGQYVDGLRAPLILHPLTELLSYHDEYIVSLTDWYNDNHAKLMTHFLSINNPTGAEPIPNAPLINEKETDLFDFLPGKIYRFRFICMTALSMFTVWIDDHKLTVVEVDGVDVEPYEVDVLAIASAQRYSVLVQAKNVSTFNYKLNAKFNMAMFDNPPADLNPLVSATIQYNKNFKFYNGTTDMNADGFDDMVFKPKSKENSVEPDTSIELNMFFGLFEDGINHGTFNNIIYQNAKVPPIFTAMTLRELAIDQKVYGINTNSFVLNPLEMIELVINNLDVGAHPVVFFYLC
jgi:iron transport multicopper oxidase